MTQEMRYVIREGHPGDLDAIETLAELLDTMNLPRDRALLRGLLATSERSFRQQLAGGEYVFVLEDRQRGRVIGTSLVIAKHGTVTSPHFFMEVQTEERHSEVPLRDFQHRVLQLGYTTDGPTEVGGLILHPDYRRAPEQLGMQLSYVRFNFIARHPERFQKEVLAELLSPLDEPGRNLFWEIYGRKFTGLDYREADRLSITDKNFILSLFPRSPLYLTMFPERVQRLLGEVAPGARGARHLLEKIGLRYLEQIDPFDGGPYLGAPMKDVTLLRDTVLRSVRPEAPDPAKARRAIISHERKAGFRAVAAPVVLDAEAVVVADEHCEAIGARAGAPVAVTPIP
ncbi:MAG: arginine N-succinyltransferase [Deltaproteobacteria bacterium]|nr:arginine N-succinyltransferase [Deltaproteobacteria bacterium]